AETPWDIHGLADADSRPRDDVGRGHGLKSQGKRQRVEPQSVERSGDSERLCQSPGAAAKQLNRADASAGTHQVDAGCRLECADEHSGATAFRGTDEIEAPMHTVAAIDIRDARRAEHGPIARGLPPLKAVRSRVLFAVRFRLDNRAAGLLDEKL